MDRQVAVDAGLAVLALVVTVGFALDSAARLSAGWLVVGVVSTVLFEWFAGAWTDAVRAVWERSFVRGFVLVATVLFLGVASRVAPSVGLSFVAGATGSYLLLVGAVELGLVAPPRCWRAR